MARREIEYRVSDEGRDKGKIFLITELPATAGEWWAIRALMALSRGNSEFSFDPQTAGMYELATTALRGLPYADTNEVKPLLDEMLDCVQVKPDPTKSVTRSLVPDDIEEIDTLVGLRKEWLALHMGFLRPGAS